MRTVPLRGVLLTGHLVSHRLAGALLRVWDCITLHGVSKLVQMSVDSPIDQPTRSYVACTLLYNEDISMRSSAIM
jgi:hypothetical protein